MTRRRTYPRWMIRGLALFAVGMTIFAGVASREHHTTEVQRNQALSRLVAVEARDLQHSDPSLAMQLALTAYGFSHTVEAHAALIDIGAGELPTRMLGRAGTSVLALGDDGHRLAVGYRTGERVQLFSLRFAQLTPLATISAAEPGAQLDTVAISDSGRFLAVGDSDGRVALWDLTAPQHPLRIGLMRAGAAAVRGLAFNPHGTVLAAADADGSVQRWSLTDPSHPRPAQRLIAPGRPALEALSFSHSGKTLAAVGRRGTIVLWHGVAPSHPLVRRVGPVTLTSVTYSPDGRTIAVGRRDGGTEIWRLGATGNLKAGPVLLRGPGSVKALGFSRDGRYLAVGDAARSVRIWSTSGWQLIGSLPQVGATTGVAFTDGDRRLISANESGETLLWQFPPPGAHRFASTITGLTYSPTTPRLAVTTATGHVDQWDIVDEWRPAPVGSWFAAPLSASPPLAYWLRPLTVTGTTTTGVTTTGVTTTLTTGTTTTGTTTTAFTPSGNPVVFDQHAGDVALRRTQAATRVLSSELSPDGELFAAAGTDHRVWLWNVLDPTHPHLITRLPGFTRWVTGVAFAGNSRTLFAASADHTVRMWDLTIPSAPQELSNSPLLGPQTPITQLLLSPNGRTLATGTAGGEVWLWGVATPAKATLDTVLSTTTGPITALAFSPSGNTLAAAGGDRRLTFWHYRPYQVVNRICALEGTPITPGEWATYVPGVTYRPPCANWKPPAPITIAKP